MEYTGERMVPEVAAGSTFWEHVHRYRFAARFVGGKSVLDVASGEGYGTFALREAGASSVVGVDRSAEACDHARAKYGVDARPGDAQRIPLPDNAVKVVVSFETIEHVADPVAFLDECRRVLRPGGTLIISTPNATVYSALVANPFHCSELDEDEFGRMLAVRFARLEWYSQCPLTAHWWSLRSLASTSSVWRRIKGFGRLARLCCPHYHGRVTDEERADPLRATLGPAKFLAALIDPYRVRPRSRWSGERPLYLVAVARKA